MIGIRLLTLASGLSLALGLASIPVASSGQADQDATVVSTELLTATTDESPSPARVAIIDMTLPRGSSTQPITSPGTLLIRVEAGSVTVVDSGRASGTGPYASGDQLVSKFDVGTQVEIPTGARISLRNAGLETVTLLIAAVLPGDTGRRDEATGVFTRWPV